MADRRQAAAGYVRRTLLGVLGVVVGATAALAIKQQQVRALGVDVTYQSGSQFLHPDPSTPPDTPLLDGTGGRSIGVTWGQWEAANAQSTMRCRPTAGDTDVSVHLHHLRPNAEYSVFYRTFGPDSYNPFCPNDERALVVPAVCKGRGCVPMLDSRITTDRKGAAHYHGRVAGKCLLSSTQVFLDLILHLDGQTYGQLPNRREYATQVEPCATDADCATPGDVCLATGLGRACQPTSCETDPSTCRACVDSYGADAFRHLDITQKAF